MANKLIYFFKYVLFAYIFIFFTVLQNNLILNGIGQNLIPHISIFIIFYSFFISKSISYFGVFLLCIIYDVLNILPIGITALSSIISLRLIEVILSKVIFNTKQNTNIIFIIFFILHTFLNLFLMTYLYNRYYTPSIVYILVNFLYFFVFNYILSAINNNCID